MTDTTNQTKKLNFNEIEKIEINKIFQSFQNEFKKTNDIEKAVKNFILKEAKDIEDIVDIDTLISGCIKLAEPLLTIQNINQDCNIDKILENTLTLFDHTFEDTTIEIFKKLIPYDKTMIINDIKVFSKITSLLAIADEHKHIINKLYLLEKETIGNRGIAKTRSKIHEAIAPRINTFENAYEFNKIPSNKLSLDLYNKFQDRPREVNAMLEIIDTNKLINVDTSVVNTIDNQKVFLNCSKPLEDTHIFTSAQIYFLSEYKKEKNPNVKPKLKNEEIAKYTNIILNDFFENEFNSNLNRKHLSKPTQHKAYFNGVDIIEYQTPKNIKKHPVFS